MTRWRLLLIKKVVYIEKYAKSISPESSINEEQRAVVYKKFTNQETTDELKKAVEDGMLDDVKKRLGITGENEDYYAFRVLNIGDKSVMQALSRMKLAGKTIYL